MVPKPPNRPDSRDSKPELVLSLHKEYQDSDPIMNQETSIELHLLIQSVNDFVRDLYLSKNRLRLCGLY